MTVKRFKFQKCCLFILPVVFCLFLCNDLYGQTKEQTKEIIVNYKVQPPKARKLQLAMDSKGKKSAAFDRIDLEGAHLFGKPGEPALPRKTARILLPPGYEIKSVIVKPTNETPMKGEFLVEPGQVPVPIGKETFTYTPPNSGIYKSERPFPGRMYSKPTYHGFRGFDIAAIEYMPFKYIPAKGRLFYYRDVSLKLILTRKEKKIKSLLRKKTSDIEKVKTLIDNPGILNYYEKEIEAVKPRPSAIVPVTRWNMAIVTNADLKPTFQSYASWRSLNRGIRATVYDIADILTNYTGYDDAEKLRNFIIDAYHNWGIEYVLLGGDVEIVPYRELFCDAGGTVADIPADIYFAGLDGNWDNDGDHIYGEQFGAAGDEADLVAEVYVGRVPVNNTVEADNFCHKIRAYEKSNLGGYRCDWLFFTTPVSGITFGRYYKEDVETRELNPPHNFNIAKVYMSQGGMGFQVITYLNAGQRIGNSCGHGDTWRFGMITSTTVDDLVNTNYPLIYVTACWTNAFDQSDCIGEHFLFTEHGAFAFIGNSDYGWYIDSGDASGPSHDFELEFYDAVMDEEIPRLGTALQDSKEEFIGSTSPWHRWVAYSLNLLGDPSTLLRLKNDIWIKTSDTDYGNLPAASPRWTSPDIAVDSPAGGWQTPSPFVTHENPEFGSTNRIYIRARNFGCEDAGNVTVKVYWGDPAGGIPWPSGWHYIGEVLLPAITPGGAVVTPYIPWTPPVTATGHRCLMATVECASDPISIHNVGWDNNIAQLDIYIVPLVELLPKTNIFKTQFAINPIEPGEKLNLNVTAVDVPAEIKMKLFIPRKIEIDTGRIETPIKLEGDKKRQWQVIAAVSPKTDIIRIHDMTVPISRCDKKTAITLQIEFPPDFLEKTGVTGQQSRKNRAFIVRISETVNGETTGGMDYRFEY